MQNFLDQSPDTWEMEPEYLIFYYYLKRQLRQDQQSVVYTILCFKCTMFRPPWAK